MPLVSVRHVNAHRLTCLMKLRQSSSLLAQAAKAGCITASGYRIAREPVLPSQRGTPRELRWPDPLAEIFEHEIVPLLKAAQQRLVEIADLPASALAEDVAPTSDRKSVA